jgi:hypothetical protein
VAQYYECMRCRAVTVLVALPARCEKCGGGTGVVFQKEDGRAAAATDVNAPALPQYENANRR